MHDCTITANTHKLDAKQAGDLSKATGSAKIALAGSTIATVGGVIAAAGGPVGVVIGGVVAAVGALIGVAGKLFGNKWHQSSGVRWLIQKYQYYVLGHSGVTSNTRVNEALLQDAYLWFSTVLGVPIYDQYRLHELRGTDSGTGRPLNPPDSYEKRAMRYLENEEAVAGGVTFNQALAAARVADMFDEKLSYGGWASFPIAPYYFEQLSCADIALLTASAGGSPDVFEKSHFDLSDSSGISGKVASF